MHNDIENRSIVVMSLSSEGNRNTSKSSVPSPPAQKIWRADRAKIILNQSIKILLNQLGTFETK